MIQFYINLLLHEHNSYLLYNTFENQPLISITRKRKPKNKISLSWDNMDTYINDNKTLNFGYLSENWPNYKLSMLIKLTTMWKIQMNKIFWQLL